MDDTSNERILTRRVERAIRRAVVERARRALQARTLAPKVPTERDEREAANEQRLAILAEQLRERAKVLRASLAQTHTSALRLELRKVDDRRVEAMFELDRARQRRVSREHRRARWCARRDYLRAVVGVAEDTVNLIDGGEPGVVVVVPRNAAGVPGIAAIARANGIDRAPCLVTEAGVAGTWRKGGGR